MASSYLTYNRDLNISGDISPYQAIPEYGTSVSFEFLDFSFFTQDNHIRYSEKELNNFLIDFNLKFTEQTEDQAKSIVSFLENVSTGVSGAETNFNFGQANASGVSIAFPTGAIYKNISGLLIDSYNVNFHNGLFDIDLNLKTNLDSPFLKWKTSSFLNAENVKTYDFRNRTEYEKFDVIYVGHTGLVVDGIVSGMPNGLYKTKSVDPSGFKIYEHVNFSNMHAYNHPVSGKWVLGSGQTLVEDGAPANSRIVVPGTTFFVESDEFKKTDIADVVNWDSVSGIDQPVIRERSNLFIGKNIDKPQRYFYFLNSGAVPSAAGNGHPPRFKELINQITGESPDNFLSEDFIFEPDDDVSINFGNSTNVLKFDSSIQEAQNLSRNKNAIEELSLTFSNRSDVETFCLLHFLEKKSPPNFFKIKLPKLFNKDKFFKVLSFDHTFVYKDCNTVTLGVKEVVEPQKNNFNGSEMFTLCTETGNVCNIGSETNFEDADYGHLFPSIATEDFKKISLEYVDAVNNKERPENIYSKTQEENIDAALNFKLTWVNSSNADEGYDLDIWVKDPNQVQYNWQNISFATNNPGLIRDNRGEDRQGLEDVGGPENLFWKDNESTPRGTYLYYVKMFNKNTVSNKAEYKVDVELSGTVVQTSTGEFFLTDTFDTTGQNFTYTLA